MLARVIYVGTCVCVYLCVCVHTKALFCGGSLKIRVSFPKETLLLWGSFAEVPERYRSLFQKSPYFCGFFLFLQTLSKNIGLFSK